MLEMYRNRLDRVVNLKRFTLISSLYFWLTMTDVTNKISFIVSSNNCAYSQLLIVDGLRENMSQSEFTTVAIGEDVMYCGFPQIL